MNRLKGMEDAIAAYEKARAAWHKGEPSEIEGAADNLCETIHDHHAEVMAVLRAAVEYRKWRNTPCRAQILAFQSLHAAVDRLLTGEKTT